MKKLKENRNIKNIFLLLFLMFFSCSLKEKKIENAEQVKSQTISNSINPKEKIKSILTFEETQDSLLKVLLKLKTNENLKTSILRELYLRGLVNQKGDKISFELPFNLHGLDCGAPDCYSTDISFEIKSHKPIKFPKNLKFKLFEHGCVDQEKLLYGKFNLTEETSEFVNYFSKELKSNLIIKRNGQLYYYPHEKTNSASVKIIDEKFENHEFEDHQIVPYQSTVMTSQSQNYKYYIEIAKNKIQPNTVDN